MQRYVYETEIPLYYCLASISFQRDIVVTFQVPDVCLHAVRQHFGKNLNIGLATTGGTHVILPVHIVLDDYYHKYW